MALIAEFLDIAPNTCVIVTRGSDSHSEYVIVYPEDCKKGIVLDVERMAGGKLNVRNVGFGVRNAGGGIQVANTSWSFNTQNERGTTFESQGGQWTLNRFGALLTDGLRQKHQFIRFKDIVSEIGSVSI